MRDLLEGFRSDTGLPWWRPDEEPRLRIIFVSPHDSKVPAIEWREAKAAQARTGAWLGVYSDRAIYDQTDTLKQAERDGHLVMPILCGFPQMLETAWSYTLDFVRAQAVTLLAEFPQAAILVRTTADMTSPADTLKLIEGVAHLCAEYPGRLHLFAFGWQRGEMPEARAYIQALVDAQPRPDLDVVWPRRPRVVLPPVVVPPVPPILPPVVKPKDRDRAQIGSAIAAVAGGVILLIGKVRGWFRRKPKA